MEWLVLYFLLVVCLSAYFLRLLVKSHLTTIQGKYGLHSLSNIIMANNLKQIRHTGDHLIPLFFLRCYFWYILNNTPFRRNHVFTLRVLQHPWSCQHKALSSRLERGLPRKIRCRRSQLTQLSYRFP